MKLNHQSWRTITNKTPTRLILGVVNWTNICCEKFLKLSFFLCNSEVRAFYTKMIMNMKMIVNSFTFHTQLGCLCLAFFDSSQPYTFCYTNKSEINSSFIFIMLLLCVYCYRISQQSHKHTIPVVQFRCNAQPVED